MSAVAVTLAIFAVALAAVRVLSAVKLTFPPGWTMHRHSHERFHELILLSSGSIEADFGDGRQITTQTGESVVYPRGISHAERSISKRPVQMVCVAFEADDPGPPLAPDSDGRVRLLTQWLAEIASPPSRADRKTRDALLIAILAERSARAGGEPAIVRVTRRYVTDHLARPITLDDLAAAACLSKFHFARQFTQATGQSPMAFVRTQRIAAARSLLATPGLPLRVIAGMVGLGDEFHLSRTFKRVTGGSPRGRVGKSE